MLHVFTIVKQNLVQNLVGWETVGLECIPHIACPGDLSHWSVLFLTVLC